MSETPTPRTDDGGIDAKQLVEHLDRLIKCNEILTQDGERWRKIAVNHKDQRDRLAEALKPFALFACEDDNSEYCGCHNCIAHEALQSLTQPTQ